MDVFSVVLIVAFSLAIVALAIWGVVGLAMGRRAFAWTLAGAGWAIAWLAVFFIAMAADWGGCDACGEYPVVWCDSMDCSVAEWDTRCRRAGRCGVPGADGPCAAGAVAPAPCPASADPIYQYCEAIDDGSVRQPWNTWSDLAFIASGMGILWWLGVFPRPRGANNPMSAATPLSVAYAAIVIFMGPASMLLHASMKSWAGWFDAFSVYSWMFFNASYVAISTWSSASNRDLDPGLRAGVTLGIWGLLSVLFGALAAAIAEWRFIGIVSSGVAWACAEIVHVSVVKARNRVDREWWFLGGTLFFLVAAMAFWTLWNPELSGPELCQDLESFPGHALFHILAACGTFFVFLFHRSERRIA